MSRSLWYIFKVFFIVYFSFYEYVLNSLFSLLGGVFNSGDERQELAFRYAVEKLNREQYLSRSKLEALTEKLVLDDSFPASKRGKTYFHCF